MNGEPLTPKHELHSIISCFPSSIISHGFAYGSGVFHQQLFPSSMTLTNSNSDDTSHENRVNNSTKSSNMIDFIFITPQAEIWHKECMKMRSTDYSIMARIVGSRIVTYIGRMGAGVYFHPMVKVDLPSSDSHHLIKYGIIQEDRLKQDLKYWDTLYVAGRMQKPVATLISSDEILELQEIYNLQYAMATSLLLMSEKDMFLSKTGSGANTLSIPIADLYETISEISYMGDPRVVTGAEDPNKIAKLVKSKGQIERFHTLYENQFQTLEKEGILHRNYSSTDAKGWIDINLMDISTRNALFLKLPPKLQKDTQEFFPLSSSYTGSTTSTSSSVVVSSQILKHSLAKIVGPPARIQSIKGLFTAGLVKSVRYAAAKFRKGSLKGIL